MHIQGKQGDTDTEGRIDLINCDNDTANYELIRNYDFFFLTRIEVICHCRVISRPFNVTHMRHTAPGLKLSYETRHRHKEKKHDRNKQEVTKSIGTFVAKDVFEGYQLVKIFLITINHVEFLANVLNHKFHFFLFCFKYDLSYLLSFP